MAQVTVRKLVEGDAKLTLHVWLESDGSGELSNYVLIRPQDLVPARSPVPVMRILQVWYGFSWFDVTLKYGGINPRPVWTLVRDAEGDHDFRHFGGLVDSASVPPADQNGQVLISTSGFAQAGNQGAMVIEFRKL